MFDSALTQAVENFIRLTHDLSDTDLERPWAWGDYDSEGVRFAFFRVYEELRALAAVTMTKRLAHEQTPTTAHRLLAQYHAAYHDLQATLSGVSADVAEQPPAENEWPVKKVLAHIVGGDVGFFIAVQYAIGRHRTGDGRPAIIPDEAWMPIIGMEESAFDAVLAGPLDGIQAFHRTWHNRILHDLADIAEAELELPSMYWESQPMSLRFRLGRFDAHMRQHTIQIDKTLEAIGQRPTEAKHLLRLVYGALAEAEGATLGLWGVDADAKLQRKTAEGIALLTDDIAKVLA